MLQNNNYNFGFCKLINTQSRFLDWAKNKNSFSFIFNLSEVNLVYHFVVRKNHEKNATRQISAVKNIALVAHDHCKQDLIRWCKLTALY